MDVVDIISNQHVNKFSLMRDAGPEVFGPALLGLSPYILTTGCTDGYAYSTLRAVRDAGSEVFYYDATIY